jgi:hypothetical protein
MPGQQIELMYEARLAVLEEKFRRLEIDQSDREKENRELRDEIAKVKSDYANLMAKGGGFLLAIIAAGGIVTWLINTIKGSTGIFPGGH